MAEIINLRRARKAKARATAETTAAANRAAFGRWRLLPRVLTGAGKVSPATTVLGQEIALPVVIAPSGRHRLCHDEGERATARAAGGFGSTGA